MADRTLIEDYVRPGESSIPEGFKPHLDDVFAGPEYGPEGNAPFGSAPRYLANVADTTREPGYDPKESVGNLDSVGDRYRALNGFNQQQGKDSVSSEGYCGAYTLVAGSMLGNGEKGIGTLIDSVEKFRAKNGGGGGTPEEIKKQAEDFQKESEELDALKARMAKGEALSKGDLNAVAGDVYGMMNNGKDGTSSARVTAMMASSPELGKMWKDNDLSYDAVDPSGAKAGGHAVLGIGHLRGDKDHTGEHAAIYDPYRRTEKNAGDQQDVVHARQDLGAEQKAYDDYKSGPANEMNKDENESFPAVLADKQQQLDAANAKELHDRKDLGQIVTDQKSLSAYRAATTSSIEMTGDDKHPINYQHLPETPFDGMYY